VKVILLGSAIVILASNFTDLLNATNAGGVKVVYPGYVTIQGVKFIEFLEEAIIASIITVVALLVDVLETAFLG